MKYQIAHSNMSSTEITSPEVMYALIYKACGSFIEECPTREEFFLTLGRFIDSDLQEEETKACFLFVQKRLQNLSYEQIASECEKIPKILSNVDDGTYKAVVDFDIDRILNESAA